MMLFPLVHLFYFVFISFVADNILLLYYYTESSIKPINTLYIKWTSSMSRNTLSRIIVQFVNEPSNHSLY